MNDPNIFDPPELDRWPLHTAQRESERLALLVQLVDSQRRQIATEA